MLRCAMSVARRSIPHSSFIVHLSVVLQRRRMPHHDTAPRKLRERTGKHLCTLCLTEVDAETYFRNELLCDACAAKDEYPLKSTPEPKPEHERK